MLHRRVALIVAPVLAGVGLVTPSRADLRPTWTVSADGRYAAFDTRADLAGPRLPGSPLRTYVHDLRTGQTVLASVWSNGKPIAGDNGCPYLSADGRSLTFLSSGSNPASLDVVLRRARGR